MDFIRDYSYYGYLVVGLVIMLESMGLLLPAETMLIAASIYAASPNSGLNIHLIALSAIVGAIMGDNFGYLIGHKIGYHVLKKYGPKIKLTPERLLLGQYLFRHHGGKVVFIGRFMVLLRLFTALLAGANKMPWKGFMFYNALGGIAWAGGYSYVTYFLGKQILQLEGTIGIVLGVIGGVILLSFIWFIHKNEKKLIEHAQKEAEREAAELDHSINN
ncbi:DedA/Tvp38 family (DedA) (PUBMED:24312110 [Commensalibacter communis]|uniref:DedA/Tvp38 family (DedA) (PUBMED:24312110) n=1 Tax=Commensalibacter communis TaxID=2972786 RepID=A0A9W4TNP1_9PROT|nr:DedA family protein [Commensalibacter communis]CAI3936717.1 DedA/Tvp38 family (DedA) (PUBMED:24312110 [Commensalibacter communis]CAI3938639.1 DedA/Tvp38 family (DedA) (PUBMED:24312110 [Commensalibacter communis]CAI3939910.1 DedA/Tvp38 family (DedA) (PUBMED:24312110 [Commensalibacter communis]CAI3941214.1 DedA/Tvp38 family (DedA) (PUBMED:24312110 [Commensalibacter communis]CAI3941509.1 DedA/Tvp38 family (DedA) (PUBMED:24312110 [Commensalibacter communis]